MVYIFDFDGTICDSMKVIVDTVNSYLTKKGKKPVTQKDIKEKGIEELVKEYRLSKLQTLLFVLKGRQEFKKFIPQLKPFPTLPSILHKLSITNHLLVLSTNSKNNIKKFLSLNNLIHLFGSVENNPFLFNKAYSLNKIIKKNKFNPNDIFYIGDELRDIKAAKKVGIKSVAVTWGYEGKELLKTAHPDFLISDSRELLLLEKQL